MSPNLQIQIIAILVSVASSLVGCFLVLRKMSMITDAITHTILLGIVVGFFITHDLNSPFLVLGAGLTGVLTVYLTEMLKNTNLVSEDSSIGIVFPLLFSIAIILISTKARSVHLDVSCVMLGELAFAPFDSLIIGGINYGAKSIYVMSVVTILNLIFITLFYKELKISTFDPQLSFILGISPVIIHYGLMTMVSITAVSAFQSAGSILVIAFMIGPPSIAYMITDNLKKMIILSSLIGSIASLIGYEFAKILDVSIAGMIATVIGVFFAIAFLISPTGYIYNIRKKRRQKLELKKYI